MRIGRTYYWDSHLKDRSPKHAVWGAAVRCLVRVAGESIRGSNPCLRTRCAPPGESLQLGAVR